MDEIELTRQVDRRTLFDQPSGIDRVLDELRTSLRRNADEAGVELGSPIEVHLCNTGPSLLANEYTVHLTAPVIGPLTCGQDGRHPVPELDRVTSCPCGAVTRVPVAAPEPDQ